MDIPLILSEICPDAKWGWAGSYVVGNGGEDYNNLVWRDDVQVKPTEQEIIDAWPGIAAELDAENAQHAADIQLILDEAIINPAFAALVRSLRIEEN